MTSLLKELRKYEWYCKLLDKRKINPLNIIDFLNYKLAFDTLAETHDVLPLNFEEEAVILKQIRESKLTSLEDVCNKVGLNERYVKREGKILPDWFMSSTCLTSEKVLEQKVPESLTEIIQNKLKKITEIRNAYYQSIYDNPPKRSLTGQVEMANMRMLSLINFVISGGEKIPIEIPYEELARDQLARKKTAFEYDTKDMLPFYAQVILADYFITAIAFLKEKKLMENPSDNTRTDLYTFYSESAKKASINAKEDFKFAAITQIPATIIFTGCIAVDKLVNNSPKMLTIASYVAALACGYSFVKPCWNIIDLGRRQLKMARYFSNKIKNVTL